MRTHKSLAATALLCVLQASYAQVFETEPNDTIAQATPIFSGVTVSAQLLTRTDVDIFSVTALQAGGMTLEMKGLSDNFGSYVVSFLNSVGAVQASYSNVRPSAFGGFSQGVSVPSAGIYFVRIISDTVSFNYSDRQYFITATFAPLVPTISTQPTDQNTVAGSTVTFAVTANGLPPLAYQWRKNGVPINGATSSALRIASATLSDAGSYSVTISNGGGTVVSGSATLTVIPLPNPSRFTNLSVLTLVSSPSLPLFTGFYVSGASSKRVLVRAIGPTLSSFNVANPINDPTITLRNEQGTILGSNDNWFASDANLMASVGAFALPAFSRDAALVATLTPGLYSVQVSGVGNATGSVLVEVYDAP